MSVSPRNIPDRSPWFAYQHTAHLGERRCHRPPGGLSSQTSRRASGLTLNPFKMRVESWVRRPCACSTCRFLRTGRPP